MAFYRWILSGALITAGLGIAGTALAADGGPEPWQMNFRDAATPVMEDIVSFHNLLLVIETIIVIVVMVLMLLIIIKFNAKSNPVPSKTTHNTILEVVWTTIPVVVLMIIAVPSMKLLFFMDKAPPDYQMTLKVTGQQWSWSYEYPDEDGLTFDSNIIDDSEIDPAKGHIRLLEVDNRVFIPVDTTIRVLVTANDVIHNWAVPAFGVKMDTVPGRINETWIRVPAKNAGVYRGQCSELCGVGHGYMPIVVEAVSKAAFKSWLVKAKKEHAENRPAPVSVAQKAVAVQ